MEPLQKFIEHPIGSRVDEGEDDSTGEYDYSHILTPEHRAAGYQLVVRHDNDGGTLDVDINHQGNYVGGVNTFLHDPQPSLIDPRQRHRAIEFHLSDLEDEHQGKGLGPAAYKAAIIHGRSLLGVTHVRGGDHSTQAHRVHQKIASELGVAYSAPENKPKAGGYQGYNKQYGPYEYPIQKNEPEPLAKAQMESDFKSVVGALDPAASGVVDHTPHLSAHPPHMEHDVGHYAQTFLYNPSIVRKTKSPRLGGVSKKVVFDDGTGKRFMVKPYHERVTRFAKAYMHRPTQGWAEMANQALFHAAGLGHMHQKVHVAEHNMGAGHENEPALVVHMEPGFEPVSGLYSGPRHGFDEQMLHDATKIAAMDYLTNNIDRHGDNLLFRTLEHHNPQKHASRLLAIDHGRNFQYKVGRPSIVDEIRAGDAPKSAMNDDTVSNYMTGAMSRISNVSTERGGKRVSDMEHFVNSIKNWWPAVRQNVIQTMHQHVGAIKDQRSRDHIWNNFKERVSKFDDMSRFPDEYIDGGRAMLETPIYTPEESANAYNPWERF